MTDTTTDIPIDEEKEVTGTPVLAPLQVLAKAEIDMQIATAKAYPRVLKRFLNECTSMATVTAEVAGECFYALPRDGKTIEGPSARLAEIVASCWGNCRAGARIVDEGPEFVTAQGVFHDLERNVAITYEVRRRITDKRGRRFKPDMVGVTGNAACSIALRNAVFKGVPKALWSGIYEQARKVAIGDVKTLANKRADALAHFQKLGATREMVLAVLNVASEEEITLDHLVVLRGLATAIKEGDTTIEQAFSTPEETKHPGTGNAGLRAAMGMDKTSPEKPSQPEHGGAK